jgi:hypothetical protein
VYNEIKELELPTPTAPTAFKIPEVFYSRSEKEAQYVLHSIDKWKECNVPLPRQGNIQSLKDAGALFTLGTPVSEWGCMCLQADPTILVDSATNLMYVREDARYPCAIRPVDFLPSSTELTHNDQGTCSGFATPVDMCFDLNTGTDALFQALDEITGGQGNLAVLSDLALPVIRGVLSRSGDAWKSLIDTNFCLGEWTGEEIKSYRNKRDTSLWKDGCTYPPYVDTNKYSIIAMMVPTQLVSAVGMCGDVKPESKFYFCVAYTNCGVRQPTFALQISGGALGCLLSNGGVAAASGGLSYLAGNGISLGLADLGFGISLTGEFRKNFTIFDGAVKDVPLNGNLYMHMKISTKGLLPEKVAKNLALGGHIYGVFQLGDGSISNTLVKLFKNQPKDAEEFIRSLPGFTLAVQVNIFVVVKLKDITGGVLPDLGMGNLVEMQAVLSTQTLPESGLLPGLYLYASTGSASITNVIKYAAHNFGGLINKLGGNGISDWLTKVVKAAEGTMDGLAFGLYINTNSFGFILSIPAVGSPNPLVGDKVTLSCKIKLSTGAITCGYGDVMAKWASAVIRGGEMLVGEVKEFMEDAQDAAVKEIADFLIQTAPFIHDLNTQAERAVTDVGDWARGAEGKLKEFGTQLVEGGEKVLECITCAIIDIFR